MKYSRLIKALLLVLLVRGTSFAQPVVPSLCNAADSAGLYKMSMEIQSYAFDGLIFLKKVNDSTLRLVMNPAVGPKILDMELFPAGYRVIYAFPKLNRKRVLRTFYEDFGALGGVLAWNRPPRVAQSGTIKEYTYSLGKKRDIVYTVDPATGRNLSGRMRKGRKTLTEFSYAYLAGNAMPISAILGHKNFRMKITLERIPDTPVR